MKDTKCLKSNSLQNAVYFNEGNLIFRELPCIYTLMLKKKTKLFLILFYSCCGKFLNTKYPCVQQLPPAAPGAKDSGTQGPVSHRGGSGVHS